MKKKLSIKLKEVENRNSPTLLGGEAIGGGSLALCVLCISLSTSTSTSCSRGGGDRFA